MAVSLAANVLTSLDRVKRYLEIDIANTIYDDIITELINSVSTAIESYCGRKLKEQQFTETLISPGSWLFVANYPVTSIISIVDESGPIANTYWKNRGSYIELTIRPTGDVSITYTGGYNPIPEDLQLACCKWVDALYKTDMADYSRTITDSGAVIRPEAIPGQVKALIDPYRRIRV